MLREVWLNVGVEKLDTHENTLGQWYYGNVYGQKDGGQAWVQATEVGKTNNGQKRGWHKQQQM